MLTPEGPPPGRRALDALLDGRPIGAARWGLERIEALLAALGHPERAFASFLIAGTNGKGSAAAFASSILAAHGIRAGLYTSPHLVDPRERVLVDGAFAPDDLLAACVGRLRAEASLAEATYFEALTALAFLCFAEMGVSHAVVEVGLGGRLDATNVLVPRATAITSIGSDHEDLLGDSPASIAREKAGIAKRGVPLVVGPVEAPAARAIADVAERVGAPVVRVSPEPEPSSARGRHGSSAGEAAGDEASRAAASIGDAIRVREIRTGAGGTDFRYVSPRWPAGLDLHTTLAGAHQAANAAVAIGLLEAAGSELDESAVVRGVAAARVAGRFEVLVRPGTTWILDVAHNREGIAALRAALASVRPPRPWTAVVAILSDKPWYDMLTSLRVDMDAIIVTHAGSAPIERRWDVDAVAAAMGADGADVSPAPSLEAALDVAAELSGGGTVLITGSAYTVGEARALLDAGGSAAETRRGAATNT